MLCLGTALWNWLPPLADRYTDIDASILTVSGYGKTRDFVFIYLVCFLSALSFWIFALFHPEEDLPRPGPQWPISFRIEKWASMAIGLVPGLLLGRLFFSWYGWSGAAGALALTTVVFFSSPYLGFQSRLQSLQLLFPFLLLRVLRLDFVPEGAAKGNTYSASFPGILLIVCVIVFLVLHAIREAKKRQLLTVSIFVLAFFSAWPRLFASPLLYDDYHLGEMILPFNQVFIHKLRYYWDFVSVHSGLAMLYGFVNSWFYQNQLTTVPVALALVRATAAGAWAWILRSYLRRSPGWIVLLLALFSVSDWDRFYFFPLLIFYLARSDYKGWKTEWPWILVAIFVLCLLNPTSGIPLALALLPLLFWEVRKGIKLSLRGFLGCILLLLLLGLFASPLIRFVLENAHGTQVAFGLPLFGDQTPPAFLQKLPFAFLQNIAGFLASDLKLFGWLIALWIIPLFWKSTRTSTFHFFLERERLFTLSCLLGLLILPYIYGRVSSEGLGRIGQFGLIYFGTILPLALLKRPAFARSLALTIILLGICFGYRASVYVKEHVSPWHLFSNFAIPGDYLRIPELENNLPGLAGVYIPPEKLTELRHFSEGWTWLGKGNYLDFTDQQIRYFLTSTAVPQLYPAFLLAINGEIQNRILAKIKETKPGGAWLQPQVDRNGVPVNLRAYRIFRWLMEEAPLAALWEKEESSFLRFD